MGAFDWTRKTGEQVTLPDNFSAHIPPPQFDVPAVDFEGRPGAYVDESRIRVKPRLIPWTYQTTYPTLREAHDGVALLAWQLSGGLGRLYPRENKDRYLRAALSRFEPDSLTGLDYRIEGEFLAPDGLWLAEQVSTVSHQITAAAGSTFTVPVGGAFWVWPTVTLTALVASVTDPELVHSDGRSLKYTGTLAAGDTLTLDPEALTALKGATGVLDAISLSWFDPQDRFSLNPVPTTLTLKAGSITATGVLRATLTWRRRWL